MFFFHSSVVVIGPLIVGLLLLLLSFDLLLFDFLLGLDGGSGQEGSLGGHLFLASVLCIFCVFLELLGLFVSFLIF